MFHVDPVLTELRSSARPLDVVATRWPNAWFDLIAQPGDDLDDEALVRLAGHAGRLLDPQTYDRLIDFADDAGPNGALLLRGVPVGDLPPTPARPTDRPAKDHQSELSLLTVARMIGQPVGYRPEHGGSVVQNLVPTAGDAARQTSTSSSVTLAFHTETAFHPHRPRYLALLCLRGDPAALTTLCSAADVITALDAATRDALRRPWYRTGVDASFGGTSGELLGPPAPILGGTTQRPTLWFDADLMQAITSEGEDALGQLEAAVAHRHRSLVLEAGDLLLIDNTRCVHGRSPFQPRFDGTDRWLQRTFVVADLGPSDHERQGRVITTELRA